jgi:hypothetical protein
LPPDEFDFSATMKILFLSTGGPGINAIDQATACLAQAVSTLGHDAKVVRRAKGDLAACLSEADVVVLPYNPFMWGRRGFAPGLLWDVARLRCRQARPRLVLIIHESYVDIRDARSLLMGGWQRAQLLVLLLLTDHRFASIEIWARKFSRIRPVVHLASGSTLPSDGTPRAAIRSELGLDDSIVVATLSTGHPSHLTSYVESSLARLSQEPGLPPVAFLQLGAGSADLAVPERVRLERPGPLEPDRLAALVRSADILLSPFTDGVSTRRTSFLAGLQQGVAVVGTTGVLTDPMLMGQGLELVPVGDREAFSRRVLALAVDEARRAEVADDGRRLFESEFSWQALAQRFLSGIA